MMHSCCWLLGVSVDRYGLRCQRYPSKSYLSKESKLLPNARSDGNVQGNQTIPCVQNSQCIERSHFLQVFSSLADEIPMSIVESIRS
jgi:hypothetical protein